MMDVVPYAFLAVTVIGCFAVLMAYRPIRREPGTILAFSTAWIAGELAFQNIVWQAIAIALFIWAGALEQLGRLRRAGPGRRRLGRSGRPRRRRAPGRPRRRRLPRRGPRPDDVPRPRPAHRPHLGSLVAPDQGHPDQEQGGPRHPQHRLRRRRHRTPPARYLPVPTLRLLRRASRHPPPGPAPVIVYVHGGAWVIGDKREQGKPMMFELVARGWVCVSINYRLSPKATWPDHIVDVKKAVAWIKEHIAEYGGDPSFVAISGGSAGGHLSALHALTAGDPAFQPGFEEADTSRPGRRPLLRGHGHDGLARGLGRLRPRPDRDAREVRHEDDRSPSIPRSSRPPRPPSGCTPAPRPSTCSRGPTTPWSRSRSPAPSSSACAPCPRQPVAYAELPLAQHAFDVLASLRCLATTSGVADFLEAALAAHRRGAAGPTPAADQDPGEAQAKTL